MGNTQQKFDNKIKIFDSINSRLHANERGARGETKYQVILNLTLSTSSSMMLEKTPPTLRINPTPRSNNPVTARQMIKAVLEQQEQQVPSDLLFDGIVDERRAWIVASCVESSSWSYGSVAFNRLSQRVNSIFFWPISEIRNAQWSPNVNPHPQILRSNYARSCVLQKMRFV